MSDEAVIKPVNSAKRESSINTKQEKRVHIIESDFSLEEDSILESRSKKRTVVISDSDYSVYSDILCGLELSARFSYATYTN